MATTKVKMDEFELQRRAQEPGQRADDRKKHASVYMKALNAKDDETSARMAKLRALRLAAEADGRLPPPVVKTQSKAALAKAAAPKKPKAKPSRSV